MLSAPSSRARRTAAITYGVRPLEAIPITVSSGPDAGGVDGRSPRLRVVLRAFDGVHDRTGPSGHDREHQFGRSAEGWAALRGVEHADTAGGSGADVDQATALRHAGGRGLDRGDDLSEGALHATGTVASASFMVCASSATLIRSSSA